MSRIRVTRLSVTAHDCQRMGECIDDGMNVREKMGSMKIYWKIQLEPKMYNFGKFLWMIQLTSLYSIFIIYFFLCISLFQK